LHQHDGAFGVALLDALFGLTPETIGAPLASAARRGRKKRDTDDETRNGRSTYGMRVDFIVMPFHNPRAFKHGWFLSRDRFASGHRAAASGRWAHFR
jgi:hypothetical protein